MDSESSLNKSCEDSPGSREINDDLQAEDCRIRRRPRLCFARSYGMDVSAILTHRYIVKTQETRSIPRRMSEMRKYAFMQAVLCDPAYRLPGLDVLIPLSLAADGNSVTLTHGDAVESVLMHAGKRRDSKSNCITEVEEACSILLVKAMPRRQHGVP